MAFGDQRVADERQCGLLAREWVEALGKHEAHTVNRAIGEVIRKATFWPAIAEVVKACEPHDFRTAEEKFGARYGNRTAQPAPGLRQIKAPSQFCREGRTEAEEIAHRQKVIDDARKAFLPAEDYKPTEAELQKPWAPARPDDGYVSPELREIAKRNRYWRGAA